MSYRWKFYSLAGLAFFLSCKTTDSKVEHETEWGINKSVEDYIGYSQSDFIGKPIEGDRSSDENEVVKYLSGFDINDANAKNGLIFLGRNNIDENLRIDRADHAKAWITDNSEYEFFYWTEEAHQIRENSSFLAVAVDQDRVDRSNPNEPYVDNSRDLFVDVYYDTDDFKLLKNGITLRGRARWDSGRGDQVRALVQSKVNNAEINANGLKSVSKADMRIDSGQDKAKAEAAVNAMDKIIKTGYIGEDAGPWRGKGRHVEALKNVVDGLVAKNALKPDEKMKVDGKTAVYSRRARYHLNLNTSAFIKRYLHNYRGFLDTLTSLNADAVSKIDQKFKEFDTKYSALSRDHFGASSIEMILGLKKYTEEFKTTIHEITKNELRSKTTDESLLISIRKVEYASSLANAFYLQSAERFLEIQTPSGWSNLMIDTFDFAQGISIKDFRGYGIEEQHFARDFDRDSQIGVRKDQIKYVAIVNEVQLELTQMDRWKNAVERTKSDGGEKHELAKEVLNTYMEFQATHTKLRAEYLIAKVQKAFKNGEIRDENGNAIQFDTSHLKWENSEASKGELSIALIYNQ